MKAHVLGAAGPALTALVQILEGQGASVSTAEPVPSGRDLYVFLGGYEAMRDVRGGLVALDLRTDVARASAGWMAYADLCLVGDTATRTFLVENYGYEPERIFVVPDDEMLAGVLRRALSHTISSVPSGSVSASQAGETAASKIGALANHLAALESKADVVSVQRPARSRVPLFGGPDRRREASVADSQSPIIEIRDSAVDGEAIARQVWERAAQRSYGPDPAEAGPEVLRTAGPGLDAERGVNPIELRAGVAKLLAGGGLHEPGFTSQVPVLGPFIVAIRRFWNWMSTKWYLRPLIKQQTQVNLQAGYLISELAQWRELDSRRLGQLEARVSELERRLRDLEAV